MAFEKASLVCGSLLLVQVTGCSWMRAVSQFFSPAEAELIRPAPAQNDLPNIQTVALAPISGKQEDTQVIGGTLGEKLTQSQRFRVVEREQLAVLSKENGCADSEYTCLSKTLPASAVVLGSISDSAYRENVTSDHYECGDSKQKKTCTTNTRKGSAKVTANLRLVEIATGRVLTQHVGSKTLSAQTTSDETPAAIDSANLLDQARAQVAQEFFELISPHEAFEKVRIQVDSDLPILDRGNEQLKRHEYANAVATYRTAVKQAEDSKEIDKKVKGKAHYNLAMALVGTQEFDEAIKELARANELHSDEDWQVMTERLTSWKADALAAKKQLAFATPNEPPTPTASNSSSAEPAKP